MAESIEATYDGSVFRPLGPVELAPNTTVRLIVESLPTVRDQSTSFLQTARSLNLQGPADWSANLDKYLYDQETKSRL